MGVVALGCKAAVAVLLVAAGGAKFADLPGFAATVRRFWPARWASRGVPGGRPPGLASLGVPGGRPPGLANPARLVAGTIATAELALGGASLASPRAYWLNLAVLGLSAGFVAVAAAGYRWHRGRSCRCFGALSAKGFSLAGIGRACLIALAAALATVHVSSSFAQVGLAGRLGLLAGALLVALAASSAASAAGVLAASSAGPGEGA